MVENLGLEYRILPLFCNIKASQLLMVEETWVAGENHRLTPGH